MDGAVAQGGGVSSANMIDEPYFHVRVGFCTWQVSSIVTEDLILAVEEAPSHYYADNSDYGRKRDKHGHSERLLGNSGR